MVFIHHAACDEKSVGIPFWSVIYRLLLRVFDILCSDITGKYLFYSFVIYKLLM